MFLIVRRIMKPCRCIRGSIRYLYFFCLCFLLVVLFFNRDIEQAAVPESEVKEVLLNFTVPGPSSICPEFHQMRDKSERITFIQTSGEFCLTPREACGVESAARANPNMKIYVYFNTKRPAKVQKHYVAEKPGKIRNCNVTAVLEKLHNVVFIRENLFDYLKGSKLWEVYEHGSFNESQWSFVHLSDALRMIMISKYGGFYLDFDVVVFRPLHCLQNSASYLEDAVHIENGVITFEKDHPFLNFFVKYASRIYDPEARMAIGPPALARAFFMYCNRTWLAEGNYSCHAQTPVSLINPVAFYPIRHNQFFNFYTPTYAHVDTSMMKDSFLAHIYLAGWGKNVPVTSLYASMARTYCPSVWYETQRVQVKYGF